MYMENATLALNQKISWMRSRTGGTNRAAPIKARTAANPPKPMVWILKYGCLGMRTVLYKVIAARNRNVKPGTKENTRSQVSPSSAWGNGRIHPPIHKVTAMDETAIMAEYSARKNSDQRNPLYSV